MFLLLAINSYVAAWDTSKACIFRQDEHNLHRCEQPGSPQRANTIHDWFSCKCFLVWTLVNLTPKPHRYTTPNQQSQLVHGLCPPGTSFVEEKLLKCALFLAIKQSLSFEWKKLVNWTQTSRNIYMVGCCHLKLCKIVMMFAVVERELCLHSFPGSHTYNLSGTLYA